LLFIIAFCCLAHILALSLSAFFIIHYFSYTKLNDYSMTKYFPVYTITPAAMHAAQTSALLIMTDDRGRPHIAVISL
jgi:hypothetical protein